MTVHLDVIPPTVTHHAKKIRRTRNGGVSLMNDEKLDAAIALLDQHLLPLKPKSPVTGAVSLHLAFTWPWPGNMAKKHQQAGYRYKTTKPDCDNLAKTLTDRLAALGFIDKEDGNVVSLHVTKFWGDVRGIKIGIVEMEQPC